MDSEHLFSSHGPTSSPSRKPTGRSTTSALPALSWNSTSNQSLAVHCLYSLSRASIASPPIGALKLSVETKAAGPSR
jgi:hypothetical protein